MRWSSLRRSPYRGMSTPAPTEPSTSWTSRRDQTARLTRRGIYRDDKCEVRRGVWATDLSPRQDVCVDGSVTRGWTTQLRLRLSIRSDVGHGTTLAHEDGVVGLPLRVYFLTSNR